jgi:hypothetical protein
MKRKEKGGTERHTLNLEINGKGHGEVKSGKEEASVAIDAGPAEVARAGMVVVGLGCVLKNADGVEEAGCLDRFVEVATATVNVFLTCEADRVRKEFRRNVLKARQRWLDGTLRVNDPTVRITNGTDGLNMPHSNVVTSDSGNRGVREVLHRD